MKDPQGRRPRGGVLWLIRILIVVICALALFFTAKHLVQLRRLSGQRTPQEAAAQIFSRVV